MYNKRGFQKGCYNNTNRFQHYGEHPLKKAWKEHYQAQSSRPPANVKELDDRYELHLFAPGLEKHDFVIALTDDNLSITVDKKTDTSVNWKRQEYTPKGFVRQFELNDKIDKTAIKGQYENGVLIVSLPKLEGFETSRQEIEIS